MLYSERLNQLISEIPHDLDHTQYADLLERLDLAEAHIRTLLDRTRPLHPVEKALFDAAEPVAPSTIKTVDVAVMAALCDSIWDASGPHNRGQLLISRADFAVLAETLETVASASHVNVYRNGNTFGSLEVMKDDAMMASLVNIWSIRRDAPLGRDLVLVISENKSARLWISAA